MFQNLKRFMTEGSYTHTDEWLVACINWIKQNYANANLNDLQFLQKMVYEQWIDANLEEMSCQCLPVNLANQKCITLPDKYGLQVNLIEDIGESAYTQWKKIKQLENENHAVNTDEDVDKKFWEPKPRRCIHLTMTDGSQMVFGLETSPIPILSLNLKPGVKIVVVGPVECRRGVIQLHAKNVKLKGGEVESFAMTNSIEAAIRTRLNMPASSDGQSQFVRQQPLLRPATTATAPRVVPAYNSNPDNDFPDDDGFPDTTFPDDDDFLLMEIDEDALASTTSSTLNTQARANATTQMLRTQDYSTQATNSRATAPASGRGRKKAGPAANTTTAKAPAKPRGRPPKAKTAEATIPQCFQPQPEGQVAAPKKKAAAKSKQNQKKIDGYMQPMPVIIKPATPKNPQPKATTSNFNAVRDESIIILANDEDEEFNAIFEQAFAREEAAAAEKEAKANQNQPQPQTSSSSSINAKPLKSTGVVIPIVSSPRAKVIAVPVSGNPYVYIKQVKESMVRLRNEGKTVFVKGCVSTITSNITMKGGIWTLTVSINDGTGFLNCGICSEVLNGIIGFDPPTVKRLKALKIASAKKEIEDGLNGLSTYLLHLNAIFGIRFCPDPEVCSIIDITMQHVNAVMQRCLAVTS